VSGRAFLAWVEPDGTRLYCAPSLPAEMVASIVEALKKDHPDTAHVAVPEEEIETWLAQS
jgi:hypothetical protein